ncbi:MAG: formate dehydrogenase accessory sulfurtransferase FdhD [Desulfobacterales bacterium]
MDTLSGHQPLRRQTLASHAAALFNSDVDLLAAAEDVGCHNALDKVVGQALSLRALG